MSKTVLTVFLISLMFHFGCKEAEETITLDSGTLQFGYRMPGQPGFKKKDANTCTILDVGAQMQYFGIGKQRLVEGANTANYDWVKLYTYDAPEDLTFSYYKDREDVQLTIDTGNYQSSILRQGILVAWMLETPKGDTIVAIDSNVSFDPEKSYCHGELDERLFMTEFFDSTGMFKEESETMYRCFSGGTEGLGEFSVLPGKTTQVIMRNNLATVKWIDSDSSGSWTQGDKLDDWTTYDGTPLMMRYEITYVD